jgi:hypothetical protein
MAGSRVTGDMRSLLFLPVASVVFTCGCSSAPAVTRAQAVSTHRQAWRPAARASQQRAAATASRSMPDTIEAVPMRPGWPQGVVYIPAGTAVGAADIGARAATTGNVVFGLADRGPISARSGPRSAPTPVRAGGSMGRSSSTPPPMPLPELTASAREPVTWPGPGAGAITSSR